MQILGITGLVCIFSIVGFLLLIRSSGPKPKKALPAKEEIFKNLIGVHGFRRDFVETEDGTLAFYRIQPNNLTVLPESVIEYQIEQMKELLQNEDDLSVFTTDGSEIGEENMRFFRERIQKETREPIQEILRKDLEQFEDTHRRKTSSKQFFLILRMDNSWSDERMYLRTSEVGKKLQEHGFANSMMEQSDIRHLLGIYFCGAMYAEKWREEDFYEYVTRDRETEEPSEKQKNTSVTEDSGPGAMELTEPCPYENRGEEPGDGKQNRKEKKQKEKKHRKSREEKRFYRERKQNRKKKQKRFLQIQKEHEKDVAAKRRKAEASKLEFSLFWKRVMPGMMTFKIDEAIIGDSYRHYMAIREYQPTTSDQALLAEIAGMQSVSLRIYYKRLTPLEEEKLLQRGSRSTMYQTNKASDLGEVVGAGENLSEISDMFRELRRNKEHILYCSVFLELKAGSRTELENLKADVRASLMADKIMADELTLQQKEGYQTVNPLGRNRFGLSFCRPLPASSVANLYPFSYSGRLDPHGIRIGKAENGTDVYLDPDRRTYDITNGNILILGGPGQGKSYLTKFLAGNVVEQGKNLYILDPEEEYRTEIANLDGTYIDFMSGEYRINILEPKRWAVDDILPLKKETGKKKKVSAKEGMEEISADAPVAFRNAGKPLQMHISFLKDFFRIYKHFSRRELDVLEVLFMDFYDTLEIYDENVDTMNSDAFPTMEVFYRFVYDLYESLLQDMPIASRYGSADLFRKEDLQSILIGICSMAQGPDSVFFNGVTNLPQDGILAFGVKGLMESNAELKDAVLFHLLSYISDKLLVQRNSVGVLDEFYLFLSSPVVVEYVRNMMKRNRKRDSFLILTSQNVEDFLLPSIREYTKPLLSIPAHRFLFYPGTVEESEYCDLLQLEECEFQVIRTASRARCLFQCGNERYKLLVQAPDYKQEMFGKEGGR